MLIPICVADFEKLAKKKLEKQALDYYRSGATEEQTLNDNCNAFKRYRLRPQVLVDVSSVKLSTSVLGSKIDFPVCIAATAMNCMAHPLGETAVAKAAAAMGTGFMLSTWATTSIEDVASIAPNSIKWMQVYTYKDRQLTKTLVQRAEKEGYRGLFLTVDTPVLGRRYRDVKNNFSLPQHLRLANFDSARNRVTGSQQSGLAEYVSALIDPSLQWSDIAWLRSITKLPIVLKGILTAEMAELAVQHGVDGILVSNHGARQLDGVPATIDALPEVVRTVKDRCEVYLDGGIRSGTDVLKALALGARAVFIGRPALWGLAHNGEEGVTEVLKILKTEFKTSMQLIGCTSIEDLQQGKHLVVHQDYFKAAL